MVHVELTDVYRLKVAVLAVVFLKDCIRVDQLLVVTLPDFPTTPPAVDSRCVLISGLESCISTD
jgi:hypothetical protein